MFSDDLLRDVNLELEHKSSPFTMGDFYRVLGVGDISKFELMFMVSGVLGVDVDVSIVSERLFSQTAKNKSVGNG